MRILHAVHFFLPKHVAGVEVYTDRLTAELAKRHEVGLIYSEIRRDSPDFQIRRHMHGRVSSFEVTNNRWFSRFEQEYRNPELLPAIADVLDEFDPEVVHIQHLLGLSQILLEEVARRRLPVLMTAHDHWFECAAGGQRFHRELGRCDQLDANRCGACTAHLSRPALFARKWVERLGARPEEEEAATDSSDLAEASDASLPRSHSKSLTKGLRDLARRGSRLTRVPTTRQALRIEQRWESLRRAAAGLDRILVPSQYLASELISFGFPPSQIRKLDYGFVKTGYAEHARLPEVARRFAFLGSLVRHKGLHILLEAFCQMPPDAILEVCGPAEADPSYVQGLRDRYQHPGISFRGRLKNNRVAPFLAEVDCLVVPSIWCENAPLVIREAFLAGVPVLASRLGGHVELLASGGGLLYEADSPAALGCCLRRLSEEPNLLRELANGIPSVKSVATHAAELEEIYRDVISRATATDALNETHSSGTEGNRDGG